MELSVNGSTHLIPAYFSFIDPERMKGWVGLVGWLVADGLPTLVVTHQLQVERRTGKVRQSETDVRRSTTVPRHQQVGREMPHKLPFSLRDPGPGHHLRQSSNVDKCGQNPQRNLSIGSAVLARLWPTDIDIQTHADHATSVATQCMQCSLIIHQRIPFILSVTKDKCALSLI